VLDPHSAVACLGLAQVMSDRRGGAGVFLATAHPAKFAEVVEPVIKTRVPLPERLEACLRREPIVTRMGNSLDELRGLLR
jgi:threonine synthase